MDPVDAEVGKCHEQRELEHIVQRERGFGRRVVEFRPAAHLADEERRGQDGHDRHGLQGLSDLHTELVAQKLRVVHCSFVEDVMVGQGRADEVEN